MKIPGNTKTGPEKRTNAGWAFWFTAGSLALSCFALAQDSLPTRPAAPVNVGSAGPTTDSINAEIKRLEQATNLDEAIRTKALEAYRQALSQLQVAKDLRAKAVAFDAAM